MPIQPHVAIVLLNYNGRPYLEKYLPFVKKTTYLNKKIYVIDNGSADDSIPFLEKTHPDIVLISNEKNLGYAGGYNKGLFQVRADYFILLNTDAEPTEDFIGPLVTLMENDPGIGICQPKILSLAKRQFFEYAGAAGGWIDILGFPFSRGRVFDFCEEDRGQYDTDTEIFWASGACMAIRSGLFTSLGGFYDYFFMYSEEIDLCWRARAAGHKIFACGNSRIYHKETAPLSASPKRVYYNFRNNLIMLHRNTPALRLCLLMPLRLLLNMLSIFRLLMGGNPGIAAKIWSAHVGFLKWLLFVKSPTRPNKKIALSDLNTSYKGSIVLQYFLFNKKKFSEIVRPGNP